MPDYSRDTDIGYPTENVVKVDVTATVADDEVVEELKTLSEIKKEAELSRTALEQILGQEVEEK